MSGKDDRTPLPNLPAVLPGGPPGGTNKKNLHIAHRRLPLELTTLMVEQYNLQRQLEQVQLQQKQILQQHQMSQQYQYPPPPGGSGSGSELTPPPQQYHRGQHSRNSLVTSQGGHRRTGLLLGPGHARRHSLGLNEAIKAAANQKVQNYRNTPAPPPQVPIGGVLGTEDPPLFKFPPDAPDATEAQPLFKFPPDQGQPSLVPPTPNFAHGHAPSSGGGHLRRLSHYRTNLRNFDNANINQNWRAQQQLLLALAQDLAPPQPHHQGGGVGRHSRNNLALEPPQFVPGHRLRNSLYGGLSSMLLMNLFVPNQQSHTPPNQNQNGRKLLFAPYLPQSLLPDLINEGRLVTGTLRVNKKNRSDAYVLTDGLLDADIFICGSKDRNRALEGDLVAVELLVVDEVWELKKEKEEKKRRKDQNFSQAKLGVVNDDIHNDTTTMTREETLLQVIEDDNATDSSGASTLGRRGSLKQRPTLKKNDDVEVEGQLLLLVEEEEINDDIKPLYAGHVVAVVDRIPGQLFAGTLGLLRPAQAAQAARDKRNGRDSLVQTPKAPKIVWFKPTDKKVPLIAIPTEQAPKDFVENHEKYALELFIALIKRWPITSLHPFGTLVTKLGKIEDPVTEIDLILRDNNFACDEYGADGDFTFELPSVDDELSADRRVEYAHDYIILFSQTGQFIDHAMHVKRLLNTKIELGFHVADISHFVEPNTILDRKAKKRSHLVFLPQRTTHVYPNHVNDAVLFKPNQKNLAVLVVFEIDTANFEVEDLYIHELIIVPKQTVSYDVFDAILNGRDAEGVNAGTGDYLKTFALIAKEFRRQRLENRHLGNQPNLTLLDQLDDERARLLLNVFDDLLAFDVISEIGHKVNGAIAAKIHAGLGELALLRRHPLPTLQKMETFLRKALNLLGVKLDTTNLATLQNLILAVDDPVKRQCVEILLYKCMPRAKYYVAGKQDPEGYGHYYLNLPLYTHFTSPLRRYADLIVHRQLKLVLNKQDEERDLDSLKAIADYCNFKKDCGAQAQEQAIHLLLSQTINELSGTLGQLLVMGTVIQVYELAFDVVIPEFGVEKRVHGDQLPLVKAEFDKNDRVLELYWERGVDAATYVPPDEKLSLSYRNLIKNKHRLLAREAAQTQSERQQQVIYKMVQDKLLNYGMKAPNLEPPKGDGVKPYLEHVITKVEGDLCIQVIKELHQVPVLIRAEIGMALPCLTVRVLNPFGSD